MKKLFTLTFGLCFALALIAQEARFSVNVSTDSVLLGNRMTVSFQLENASSQDITFPTFAGCHQWSGPNMSTQMSFMNGMMSQSVTYSFVVEPQDVGDLYIEPASVKIGEDQYIETDPILIQVHPNPEGIIQQESNPFSNSPFSNDFFGQDFFSNDFFSDMFPDDLFQRNPFENDFFNSNPFLLDSTNLQLLEDMMQGQQFGPQDLQPVEPGTGQRKRRKTTRI